MRYFLRFSVGLAVLAFAACGGGEGVCGSFCAKDAECYPPEEQIPRCEQWCGYLLDVAADSSAECGAAMADVFACVSDLQTCEEVDGWWFGDPWDSYPCKAADDTANSACMLSDVGSLEVQP
jgi:hypothetical protein